MTDPDVLGAVIADAIADAPDSADVLRDVEREIRAEREQREIDRSWLPGGRNYRLSLGGGTTYGGGTHRNSRTEVDS